MINLKKVKIRAGSRGSSGSIKLLKPTGYVIHQPV